MAAYTPLSEWPNASSATPAQLSWDDAAGPSQRGNALISSNAAAPWQPPARSMSVEATRGPGWTAVGSAGSNISTDDEDADDDEKTLGPDDDSAGDDGNANDGPLDLEGQRQGAKPDVWREKGPLYCLAHIALSLVVVFVVLPVVGTAVFLVAIRWFTFIGAVLSSWLGEGKTAG